MLSPLTRLLSIQGKKDILSAAEMAQWIKCLPHKLKDLSSDPKEHQKELNMSTSPCKPQSRGCIDRRTPGLDGQQFSWLNKSALDSVRDPCQNKVEIEEDTWHWPFGLCMPTHLHVHTHTYIGEEVDRERIIRNYTLPAMVWASVS